MGSLLFRDPPDSVLIESPPERGRNALIDRKAREYATTTWPQTVAERLPPWPVIDMRSIPNNRRVSILRLPIITRLRARLAAWIQPR